MLLKKQTVWLLTMLSLVVVLSVYYITSPEQMNQDLAAMEEKANEEEAKDAQGEATETESIETEDGEVISSIASDEVFEALRLELDTERSKMKEELTEIMASTDLPADKRSEAYDQMQKLDQVAQQESVLETLIKAMGYDDALVRADGDKVRITVKSNDHSPAAANDIIQLVKNEIGQLQAVAVQFEPSK
ncbi:SpoIIIAH-like family protein [Cytobacillus spongiae]|jgi:stage III sporulation protein AH|uniref:SpoIIIAH-like family protein n=1 Tax=Cytobacillus spongiae TaxID=2901381 RepID=UPI001F3C1D6A|nr:SpoIIIAH-like family protein [Cytobacillus spongiae]UII54805.1 SpoIIIAH-like family protein [Cytobacillus spongiae]